MRLARGMQTVRHNQPIDMKTLRSIPVIVLASVAALAAIVALFTTVIPVPATFDALVGFVVVAGAFGMLALDTGERGLA